MTLLPASGRAEVHVRSPVVDYREFELEMNGFVATKSKEGQFNNGQSYTYSLGYGVMPWWKVELEGETGAAVAAPDGPGERLRFEALTLENTFQLVPQGKYPVDLGLFLEYSRGTRSGSPDSVEGGLIVQREEPDLFGVGTLHTLNLFLGREVSTHASHDTGLIYAWQSKALLHPLFNPGVEFFGEIASVTRAGQIREQGHSVGPVVTGERRFTGLGKLKYELGYQWGLTNASARGGVRWKVEYEIAF